MNRICKYCQYFKENSTWGGECRFNPPFEEITLYDAESVGQHSIDGIYRAKNTRWVHVNFDDYCGQFTFKDVRQFIKEQNAKKIRKKPCK